MNKLFIAVGAVALLAAGSASAQDVAAGEKSFNKCKACHSIVAGKNGVGPSLFGVYGRKVGEAANYKYSDAHLASGLVWNDENLDKYITDPKGTIPGNKMVFAGIKDAEERKNLIAYLATLK